MGERRRQSLAGEEQSCLAGAGAGGKEPEQPWLLLRRRAASLAACLLVAAGTLLLLLSQTPTTWLVADGGGARREAGYSSQRYNTDETSFTSTEVAVSSRIAHHSLVATSSPAQQKSGRKGDGPLAFRKSTISPGTMKVEAKPLRDLKNETLQKNTNKTRTSQQRTHTDSPVTLAAGPSTESRGARRGDAQGSAKRSKHPKFGSPSPGDPHIIFVETSCALTDVPKPVPFDSESGLRISPRAACAVESAARAHPDRRVYLLHTCAVRASALARSGSDGVGGGGSGGVRGGGGGASAPAFALAALSLPNVRLWHEPFAQLFADSPLEEWLATGALHRSTFPVTHAADTLRFVVLWKFGGTYLDSDVLMLRSLGSTRDFACPESSEQVSIGAMDMSRAGAGRHVVDQCLVEERYNFAPHKWAFNGPGAITRALQRVCHVEKVSDMTPERCGGYTLLPTSAFYPIPYQQWRRYFQEEDSEATLAAVNGSVGVHVWNALSYDAPIHIHSRQPYAQLARRLCPSVVAAMNGTM